MNPSLLRFLAAGLALCFAAVPWVQCEDAVQGDPRVKDYEGIARLPALEPPGPVSELLIHFKPGTDVHEFADRWGLTVQRVLRSDSNMVVLKAASDAAAQERMQWLVADRVVEAAYYDRLSQNVPRAFVPNDPFFSSGNGFPGQWHLVNPLRPDLDSNVRGAWNRDLTGAGVIIGIADDGVETAHPDLSPNYLAAESWNFVEQNSNPNPVGPDDNHGTSVAGVAAARGGNGIGVTGAAPLANIAGLRLPLGGGGRLSDFVDVVKFRSFGQVLNIKVKNHSYGVTAPFVESNAERDAVEASAAAGTIHVWAAGNERGKAKEDANKDPVNASPHVIAVAALGSSGLFSDYSCYGANVVVTAPSNSRRQGEYGQPGAWTGIATTDRTGNVGYNPGPVQFGVNAFPDRGYTSDFGGTSSAAPLVSGIMALGVQANPALNVRMAKHLLARTSRLIDATDNSPTSDGGWKTNAAGFRFNPNYGFGLIDADAFTRQAVQFSGVTPVTISGHDQPVAVNAPIPDQGEVSRTFTVNATTPLEEVQIYLNIQHTFRGDLEVVLISPSGTASRLCMRNGLADPSNQGGLNWWFLSNAFWGENPSGTWTLKVRDAFAGDTGTWTSYQARLRMGQLIASGTPTPPTVSGFAPAGGGVGTVVTINGTKFTDATAVQFNGVNANFTVQSASQLSATVPPGAGSGPIRVITPGGSATSVQTFQVNAGPVITTFTPSSGSPGTSVTIAGSGFTGATAVTFNGVNATFSVRSSTEIDATVPAQANTGRIGVVTPSGTATSAGNFTVTLAPALSSFSPVSGGPGTTVTLLGANFSGATSVRFNGIVAVFTVESATRIVATVPTGAGTGPITVTTPQGVATSATPFTVLPPPVITGFTPTSGSAGSSVTIEGAHFLHATAVEFNGVPATAFTVEASTQIRATVPSGAGSGPIRVVTPSGAATSAAFTVVGGPPNDSFAASILLSGSSGSATGSNVGASREVNEPSHANNAGGRSIWYRWQAPATGPWSFNTIGSTFDTLLAVYQGDALGTLLELAANDDTAGGTNSSLVFTAQASMTYRIAVDGFNPDPAQPALADSGTLQLHWAPLATAPVITGFTPAQGPVGTSVTIEGSGFTGATTVQFGGVNAAFFTVLSPERLTATVPAGAGTGLIRVVNPAGAASSAQAFTVQTGSANDHFADAQSLTGTQGTVTGNNAGASKEPGEPSHAGNIGGRSVWYSWTAPSDGTWSFDTEGSTFDTLLAVYTGSRIDALTLVAENDDAPDLPNRASRVTFTASAGTTYRLAIDGYVGLGGNLFLRWELTPNAPAISGFTPAAGTIGTSVVVTGIHLQEATSVRFNHAPAAFTIQSPTRITAVVPADATSGPIRIATPEGLAVSSEAFVLVAGPANDHFAAAEVLSGPAVVVSGGNQGATREPNEPFHADEPGGRSIWYRWTAPATGRWTLDTFGSRFDTTLAVYTGTTLPTLTELVANDDAQGLVTSQVSFDATNGATYAIAVDGYDGDSGDLILRLLPAAPSQVIYSTGFEASEGFSPLAPLSGQGGWLHDGSGGNGVVSDLFAGLGQQAFIGFFPPEFFGDSLFVWRPLNHTPNLGMAPVVRFSVRMMIVDSSNFAYDDFAWSVYNRQGQRLLTLTFDNSDLGIYYRLDGPSEYVWTEFYFSNEVRYDLSIVLDFQANRWSALIEGDLLVDNAPITTTGLALDLGDIDAVWVPQNDFFAGDNFMLFDNYRVLAEGTQAPVIVLQPKSQSVAAGQRVTLTVGARGAEPLSYQWRFNGQDLPGANDPILGLANFAPSQAGTYSVLVRNAFGLVTSQDVEVTVPVMAPIQLASGWNPAGDALLLTVTGSPGVRVTIQVSSDLVTWADLETVTLVGGRLEFVDPQRPNRSQRFYRVRLIP
jgi:subtilisin family serine protease